MRRLPYAGSEKSPHLFMHEGPSAAHLFRPIAIRNTPEADCDRF